MLCAVLAALLTIVPMTSFSRVQAESVFQPMLDTDTSCEITVIGSYSNFEALEAEFESFNEIYPDVELSYLKPDDYNNLLGTVLESSNAPNIFFSNPWMYGNEKYQVVLDHMEDLSDPQLGLNLDCIRPSLLSYDTNRQLLMVPVFARNYGMLVNNNLFEKEGLQIPLPYRCGTPLIMSEPGPSPLTKQSVSTDLSEQSCAPECHFKFIQIKMEDCFPVLCCCAQHHIFGF